jgi:hypothetical protein
MRVSAAFITLALAVGAIAAPLVEERKVGCTTLIQWNKADPSSSLRRRSSVVRTRRATRSAPTLNP